MSGTPAPSDAMSLEVLYRSLRRTRALCLVLAVILGSLTFLAMNPGTPEAITTRRLIIVDSAGNERALVGADPGGRIGLFLYRQPGERDRLAGSFSILDVSDHEPRVQLLDRYGMTASLDPTSLELRSGQARAELKVYSDSRVSPQKNASSLLLWADPDYRSYLFASADTSAELRLSGAKGPHVTLEHKTTAAGQEKWGTLWSAP